MSRHETEQLQDVASEKLSDVEYEASLEFVRKLEVVIEQLGFIESAEMQAISGGACPISEADAQPIVESWYRMGEACLTGCGAVESSDYRRANLGFQLAYAALYHRWGVGELSVGVFDDCLDMAEQDPDLADMKEKLRQLW